VAPGPASAPSASDAPGEVAVGQGVLDRLLGLSAALRRAGVDVTQAGTLDAVRALEAVGLARREQVRAALAATTLTSGSQRPTFDALFDLFLPDRPAQDRRGGDAAADGAGPMTGPDGAGGPDADPGAGDDTAFLDELVDRLLDGSDEDVRRLAREAVDRFGRLPGTAAGRPGSGGGWFRYRVLRAVDPGALLAEALRRRAARGELSPLAARLAQDELEARLATLRAEIDAEVRRRAAADRDPDAIARASVPAALADLDLLHLRPEEQLALRAEIRPLARRLAARAAVRRRRGRDGRLDVRRTVRSSLATGGVPFEPAFRARRPHRPELFLLCDVSGSVASFARFTLLLVHAMQEQFAGVRSFAFVDALDEVTDLFRADDPERAVTRLLTEARVVWADGHSDYGRALTTFLQRHGGEVTGRSTVVVLGDARTNHRPPEARALELIQRRARRVWWLNPEPRVAWDTGDSVAASYARFTEEMVEVRTLKQLAAFVERVA
jgi:uncharacterized protein with von Willebrand factor type A (vWA) domain